MGHLSREIVMYANAMIFRQATDLPGDVRARRLGNKEGVEKVRIEFHMLQFQPPGHNLQPSLRLGPTLLGKRQIYSKF
jgi:hypothetical protein